MANEPFVKALQSLENCVLVNDNLRGKLVSSFDKRFKVAWVPLFIPDFKFLSCKLDNFTFKVLYWVILDWYYTKMKIIVKHIRNAFTVPSEKIKLVSFAASIMKNVVVSPSCSRLQ